ncbi:MAG: signal peptidase II [Gemmatimonadales bacterium]
MARKSSRVLFWLVGVSIVVLDFASKQLAVARLSHGSVPIVGEWLSFRLVHNPGAAFGIDVGQYSRWIFMGLAIVALIVLGAMVRQTLPEQRFRLFTLGLVCGGAVGNLIDRITNPAGVVDFIDVWIQRFHWPTFNVADMAVSCGAVALATILWSEGKQEQEASGEPASPAEVSS